MSALAAALACWLGGACGAFLFRRRAVGTVLGVGGAIAGGVAAALCAAGALTSPFPEAWRAPWSLPGGAFALRVDRLGSVFLLPIALVGALCAVYGVAYLRRHVHEHALGGSFAAYNVLLASMATVVTANDLLLLLIAWELMTLSSWALVVSDHRESAVRAAGLQYLVAGHLATIALLLLTLFLASGSGSFEIMAISGRAAAPSGLLFVLVLVGFGTKAGIVPMHVWLPDAHPAAPSHVSALMSAVMVTMGFYGLARFIPLLGEPALWWAYLLLLLGATGAVGGILFALAQRDVKRVLAYSTVENAGIATLALGLGVLGTALGRPVLAGIGWTAALLHLWNHALAKAALFLGFGAVAQGVGSRNLDMLGGILTRWRLLGSLLVIGAAAIAALPGLNVFTSEWLLLRGLLVGGVELRGWPQVAVLGAVGVLALTGGLAVVCFARLVGIGLLGAPRTAGAAGAPRPGPAIWIPVLVFAAACVLVAIIPGKVAGALAAAVAVIAPAADAQTARDALGPLGILPPLIVGVAVALLALRGAASRRPLRARAETWGCGYASPAPSMQYTSMSFSEPLMRVVQPLLRTEVHAETVAAGPAGAPWLLRARRATRTPDRVLVGIYEPLFAAIERGGARLRALHRPRVTASLLYIVVTVLVLLALLFLPGARV